MKYYLIIIISFFIVLTASTITNAGEGVEINSPDYQNIPFRLTLRYPDIGNGLTTISHFSAPAENDMAKTNSELKSKGKALLLSLLVPGAGQRYLGHKNYAKGFFITEVVLWAGVISFYAYSDWKREDLENFAAIHADARIDGKKSQYFVDMGNYLDIYEYNNAKQLRREFTKVYDVDEYYWAWDNAVNQHDFEQMRISSDRAQNRAVMLIGGIVANHILSGIDAVWKTYRYNKQFSTKTGLMNQTQFYVHSMNNGSLAVTFQKMF